MTKNECRMTVIKSRVPAVFVLCLVLTAAGWCAAQGAAGSVDVRRDLRETHAALRDLPPAGVGFVILLSLIPVFWGWKVVRAATALLLGAVAGAWLGALALAASGALMISIFFGAVGFIGGALLGWWCRQLLGALWGAAFLGGLLVALGTPLAGPVVGVGLGTAGAIIGLIVGWTAILYVDAIVSAIGGAALAGSGVAVLTAGWGGTSSRLAGLAVAVILAVAGISFQCRTISRMKAAGAAPGTGGRSA